MYTTKIHMLNLNEELRITGCLAEIDSREPG